MMNQIDRLTRAFGIAACAAMFSVSTAAAYEGGAVANGGTIKGMVKFNGTAPERAVLEVNKDKKVCAVGEKKSNDLVVGGNSGIQFAVVSLTDISKGKAFPEDGAVLDQAGCEYLPYVVVVQKDAELLIKNSDGILHNIHTYSEKNKPVNRAQPKFKKKIKEKFSETEMVKVTCDVHGWMKGWLAVADSPYYAITDESGNFELADVPAGEYEIRVWQETLGESTQKVSVPAGGEASVTFELAAK